MVAGGSPPQRLRRRADFLTVGRRGRRAAGQLLVVQQALQSPPEPLPRLGLTVSRRVGNAVCRNRVRRRLKEIVRCRPDFLGAGCDVVVIALPAAATASFVGLAAELQTLLARLRGAPRRPVA